MDNCLFLNWSVVPVLILCNRNSDLRSLPVFPALHVCMFSYISFVTLWITGRQVPLSMEFPRQEYWSGLLFPPPGDLPNLGTEPAPSALEGEVLTTRPLLLWKFVHISYFLAFVPQWILGLMPFYNFCLLPKNHPPLKNKDFPTQYVPKVCKKNSPNESFSNAQSNDRLGISYPKAVLFKGTTSGYKVLWRIC